MKRRRTKPRKTATLRFSPEAAEMVKALAADTGWSANNATNTLIRLGMHAYTAQPKAADAIAEKIATAIQTQLIKREADERIKALHNRK